MSEEMNLGRLFFSSVEDVLGGEDLIMEVARDMIKDELKAKVKKTLDDNPELRDEMKLALNQYYEAKITQTLAAMKIAKASIHLGLRTVPKELQDEVTDEVEKEINRIIDDTL
jgi:hypothetical protein